MKTQVKLLAAAALSVAASLPLAYGADSATTAPVGYRTETLANGFNLMAANLLTKVESAGTLETASGMTVTDAQANFSGLGTADLLLKITDGTAAGTVIQCNQTNATTLTAVSAVPAAAAGAKYELRIAHTISSLFGAGSGATAPAPFAGGDLDTGDNIYIPNGAGGFIIVYYNDGSNAFASTGWVDVAGDPAGNIEIPYNLAFYIRNIGAVSKDLVLTGHVADTVTTHALVEGYNYVSRVLPVGYTLDQSGIQTQIRQGDGSEATTDRVYLPLGPGNFRICYFNDGSDVFNPLGWIDLSGAQAGTQIIPSGFLIQRTIATPANLNIIIPNQFDV